MVPFALRRFTCSRSRRRDALDLAFRAVIPSLSEVGRRRRTLGGGHRIGSLVGLTLAALGLTSPVLAAPPNVPGAPIDGPSPRSATPSSGRVEPARNEITPPRPLSTPSDYPGGASGSDEVTLELLVDEDGRVADARALSGDSPFAEAAVVSARSWHFEPARRRGRPVRAKILFLVRYTETLEPEPAEGDETVPETAPNVSSSEANARAEEMHEVVVRGKVRDPGARSITRAEVRNLPGAFDDPLRSIEVMPGVTPIATGLPLFFVRGAPPGNVGFFVDGIRIPLLYHAFLGPSVVHPAMLDRVDLHAGAAPARFGRFAGAIVDAELTAPSYETRGEANVRIFDAGAFVEAPWADGRGYAVAAGRFSYTSLILSLLSDDQTVEFWDYQGHFGYRLTPKDTLSVFGFGAFDYVGTDDERSIEGTEFHRVDLRWDHDFSTRARSRVALTWGRDRTRSNVGFVSDDVLAARASFEHRAEDALFRVGGDVSSDSYELDVEPSVSDPLNYMELFPTRDDLSLGLYGDVVLFPDGPISVTPGVRADLFRSMGRTELGVDPRISATYRLTDSLRTNHTVGIAHQSPNFVPAVPGAQVGGLPGGLQTAAHASSDVEADLPGDLTGSLGVFLNGTFDMSDPIGLSQSFDIDEESTEERAFGRSEGIELHLRRPLTQRLGGLLSYTLSRSSRSFDRTTTRPAYDRTHVLNAALSYDLGNHLRASGKLAVASGVPGRRVTPDGTFVFDGSRSSPFVRLDLKLSKRWYTTPHFWWGVYGEVLNATHGSQVVRRSCNPDGCTDSGQTPITIPSVGIEASWQ